MKKTLLLAILFTCMLFSCGLPDDESNPEQSTVIILLIDYTTNTFQAGASLFTPVVDFEFTELPVAADITEPTADLNGSVSLVLTPTGEQIFSGELSEEGIANVFAPTFIGPQSFLTLVDVLPFPTSLLVEDIDGPYQESFETAWETIGKLNIVDLFRADGALFGRYLYKPSEDVSENWQWVIVMYNQ